MLLKLVMPALPAVNSFASAEADRPGDHRTRWAGRASDSIGFASNWEGETHLHVIRVSPGEMERLTNEGGNYAGPVCSPEGRRIAVPAERIERYDPAWSPTGKKIACAKTCSLQIHVNGSNGENYGTLTGGGADNFAPAYSPNGEKMICSSGERGGHELYVMYCDVHTKRRVLDGSDSVERRP